jgi:hypothetical protein
MKKLDVKLPDGRTVTLGFEDDASGEEMQVAAARLVASAPAEPVEQVPEAALDFFERRPRKVRVISAAGAYYAGERPPRRAGGYRR